MPYSGVMFGDFAIGSVTNTLTWSLHKSKRPVRSIESTDILADAGKVFNKVF